MSTSLQQNRLKRFGWESRYELLDKIGAGSMGEVWRARDCRSGETVALKLMDPAREGDDHLMARMDLEAGALRKLREAGDHENIVPIIDFKITDSSACLVMEFIPGLTLARWCEGKELGIEQMVTLIMQVARASGWFHQLGVIHRDIKPANILVSAVTGQPVIVDFSIAKVSGDAIALTLTNEALGTLPYMAPEQLGCHGGLVTPATDVYAIGATLYELVTHVHPHPGNLAHVLKRHSEEVNPARPTALKPGLPKDLESIILKALFQRPADRYPDGGALAADLERFLQGKPVTARPLSHASCAIRRFQRRPALAAAMTVCLALGGATLWSLQRHAEEKRYRVIEGRLTNLIQGRSWAADRLAEFEALAGQLGGGGGRWMELVKADMLKDMAESLRKTSLDPADVRWIRDGALPWLAATAPREASQMRILLDERLGKWRQLHSARSPFSDLGGLFPEGGVEVIDGALVSGGTEGLGGWQVVKDRLVSPLEVRLVFDVSPMSFTRMGVSLVTRDQDVRVSLSRPAHLPARESQDPGELDGSVAGPVFLCLETESGLRRVVTIPDETVLQQQMSLTVRFENRGVSADLGGRWTAGIDDVYQFASMEAENTLRTQFCDGTRLRQVTLKVRESPPVAPMALADIEFRRGRYQDAARMYEGMLSDAEVAAEANFKLAECAARMGHPVGARQIWETVSTGESSLWQQLSALQLWDGAAISFGPGGASQYLSRLPDAAELHPAIRSQIGTDLRARVHAGYVRVGRGLSALLHQPEKVDEALKAYQIVGVPETDTASTFALPLHCNGLDAPANHLLWRALLDPSVTGQSQSDRYHAVFALDRWTQISRSETTPRLSIVIRRWCGAFSSDPNFDAIGVAENTRRLARAGEFARAIDWLNGNATKAGVDDRLLVSRSLLEAEILEAQGMAKPAMAARREGLENATRVERRGGDHLLDLIALHSATQTWTRDNAAKIMTELIGLGQIGAQAHQSQVWFVSTFLKDDGLIRALNRLIEQDAVRELIRSASFREVPARSVNEGWFVAILESYLCESAFSKLPDALDRNRVHEFANKVLEVFRAAIEDTMLHGFFDAWRDGLIAGDFPQVQVPKNQSLADEMEWLLGQRRLHLGLAEGPEPNSLVSP